MNKRMAGNAVVTADLNWPKGYSMPYSIVLRNKKLEDSFPQQMVEDWLGISWVGGDE